MICGKVARILTQGPARVGVACSLAGASDRDPIEKGILLMRYHSVAAALLVGVLVSTSPADESPLRKRMAQGNISASILQTANLIQATRYPELVEQCIAGFKSTYWALQPDVTFSPDQRTFHEKEAAAKIRDLARLIQDRRVGDLFFVGIDDVGAPACMDWHYVASTPQGPVLFTVSIFLADGRVRLKDIRYTTDWSEIKKIARAVDMKLEVPGSISIQFKPPAQEGGEKKPAGEGGKVSSLD